MANQAELDLSPQASSLKVRQLAALRAPHSVVIDFDTGKLEELRGDALRNAPPDVQWEVPNQRWLERIRHFVSNYRQMLEQHARERGMLQSLLNEILSESRQLTAADIPKPAPRQPNAAEAEDGAWREANPNGWDNDEDYEVPF